MYITQTICLLTRGTAPGGSSRKGGLQGAHHASALRAARTCGPGLKGALAHIVGWQAYFLYHEYQCMHLPFATVCRLCRSTGVCCLPSLGTGRCSRYPSPPTAMPAVSFSGGWMLMVYLDVLSRCYILMLYLMLYIDVIPWCYILVLYLDVISWCYISMLYLDCTKYMFMVYLDVIAWFCIVPLWPGIQGTSRSSPILKTR